ncbi:MAG TPA: hypothetical protein VNZ53_59815 [Steroidobacteraceae bacterium]|nr:hypothetical protein [Steroidobacteraceae bacterium]
MRVFIAIAAVSISWANAAWGYQPLVNYQLRCMGCHLADGSGQPGRVPSIRRSLVLFSTFPEGRAYVVRVPGVAQSPLSDEDTAALLNWMAGSLSDIKVPRGFVDYSAAEVHDLRAHPLAEVSALRAHLWKVATAKPRLH